MTITVNIHEAKTHLSKLLNRVMNGEEIIIAKAGKPVARLTAISQSPSHRTPLFWHPRPCADHKKQFVSARSSLILFSLIESLSPF